MIKLLYWDEGSLHYSSEIKRADEVIGLFLKNSKKDVTYWFSSDIFILRIAQAIRAGVLASNDVQIYCHKDESGIYDENRPIRFDIKGDFIEPWVIDDLFEVAFHLRFNKYYEYPPNVCCKCEKIATARLYNDRAAGFSCGDHETVVLQEVMDTGGDEVSETVVQNLGNQL